MWKNKQRWKNIFHYVFLCNFDRNESRFAARRYVFVSDEWNILKIKKKKEEIFSDEIVTS